MSIKKLFESIDSNRKYLAETDSKDAFASAESERNVAAKGLKQKTYESQLDFSTASNFAKYGSAELYYESAMDRILDFYPYDGSEAELNEYYNNSLPVDKYVFNKLYPRTHGQAVFSPASTSSATGWGTSTIVVSGTKDIEGMWYGKPSELEYIHFFGGPGTASLGANSSLASLAPNNFNNQFKYSNIYDEDIYTTAGLPSTWGSGSRESNLMADFGRGVTIEFWMKTGSYDNFANFTETKTGRQVIFDMWNGYASSSAHYGRITLELTGGQNPTVTPVPGVWDRSPFRLTVQSGTSGIYNKKVGFTPSYDNPIVTSSIGDWSQWAISMKVTSSHQTGDEVFQVELYRNGHLHEEQLWGTSTSDFPGTFIGNEINSKNMRARIGSLITAPSGTAEIASWAGTEILPTAFAGAGKLSASLDEFRYWKVRRTPKEIGDNWFTQVRGGVNTDISNTTLGLYYKFNEGITHTASVDSIVLDYGGRICNGVWNGYVANSRNTGSAMILAKASPREYKDPIIYSFHPDVSSLKTELLDTGSYHDAQNNANFVSMLPAWIIEEDEQVANSKVTNLQMISHIMGAYFDKLHMQITQIPKLKHQIYTSASYKPLPFAQHLPQSLGLYTPEIFIDSTVLEKFANRTLTGSFEEDLNDTKNLIYLNLYNNLTNIYKSKGTEKAIRNVMRCFNVDEGLMRLNVYADDTEYELKNNLRQSVVRRKTINHNNNSNIYGVVYQKQDTSNGDSIGFISGSWGVPNPAPGGAFEDPFGFTAEIDVKFPRFFRTHDKVNRNFFSASLFGMHTVNTGSAANMAGTNTAPNDPDPANFQVYACRPDAGSKKVFFRISSSMPNSATNGPIPELTSSIYPSVYDDTDWNVSVRLAPRDSFGNIADPNSLMVSGAVESSYDYLLIFQGYNTFLGSVQNEFTLTSSISKTVGENFLRAAKRMYCGARRTNIVGSILQETDVNIASVRYYNKYIEDAALKIHANNFDNSGVSGSYRNLAALPQRVSGTEILNNKTLVLSWNFDNVTSSNSDASFVVTDMSSGSALIRNNFGWIGNLAGYQHTAGAYGFPSASTDVVEKKDINSFKFINPEMAVASDMVQITTADDEAFIPSQTVPDYYYTLEKSIYNAISEEMLKFFAGVVDFNNLIGEPVNRYRHRYKKLEKLREIFFRKVSQVSTVEKYVDYYKWFDDSLTTIISQLLPASAYFVNDVLNIVESHALERNKYQTPFPTLDATPPEPDSTTSTRGAWDGSPLPSSPRATNVSGAFWKKRALRTSTELTALKEHPSNAALANTINSQKETFRKVINSTPYTSQSLPNLFTAEGTQYFGNEYALHSNTKLYDLKVSSPVTSGSYGVYRAGVNFGNPKNIDFTYNALRPAGPVNTENNTFIPENVLVAFTEDIENEPEIFEWKKQFTPHAKYKRVFKVNHGRDWQEGEGYKNLKSTFAFPFNVISSSVNSGYNRHVIAGVGKNVEITNLHNDVYGDLFEVPMQGPFTDYAVGGHQSRHVALNYSSSARALDTYLTRPEAWKLLLGTCIYQLKSGAIGMVGPDYPWPEANEPGILPYPMTGSQKAWLYRDFVAKRPVNIRNIEMKTGSTILGNYSNKYEVVHSVGAFQNPKAFIENQPSLPSQLLWSASTSSIPTQVRTYLSTRRNTNEHFQWVSEYSTAYLTGATNKSIITGRFAAPGGIDTMTKGYLDFRSTEYSVYNALNWRNLSVLRPWQGPSGTISQATGSGIDGIRVRDILGKDYALISHLSRHTARFGRDPIFASNFGESYNQNPNFHKVNRNAKTIVKINNDADPMEPGTWQVVTSSRYDNFYVQHAIPTMDKQYAWISASITGNEMRFYGQAPTWGMFNGLYSSSVNGWGAYFDFVSASSITPTVATSLYQPTNVLNVMVVDSLTGSGDANTLGFSSDSAYYPQYLNSTLLTKLGASVTDSGANYLNLLLSKRGAKFGWNWKATRQQDNPILRNEHMSGVLSIYNTNKRSFSNYNVPPVSKRGHPMLVNFDISGSDESVTIAATHNNQKIYFNSVELNNLIGAPIDRRDTPFYHALALIKTNRTYNLNWILYNETVFPSIRNEFVSRSTQRLNFNNKMWRDTLSNRVTLGSELSNSFGVHVMPDSYDGYRVLSQSCHPMDVGPLWQTRTSASNAGYYPGTWPNTYRIIDPAGELQNNYFFYHIGFAATTPKAARCMTPGALYARKHGLSTFKSVVSPTGPSIAETGSINSFLHNPGLFEVGKRIDVFGGEAKWEANSQAGIVLKSGSSTQFVVSASAPWWDSYDDYKQQLQLISRGYSIIPEFRISENIEDYVKYGLANQNKTNTFGIVGTDIDSTTGSFYRDYSNSEFLRDFLNIKDTSKLQGAEIRLICSAAIRPIFYKGFFPAQRSLDLVSQFSRSYGEGLTAELGSSYESGNSLIKLNGGALRPLMQSLYSPGLLYNSIKAGVAVDYPIVTDPYKLSSSFYGAAAPALTNNWAITPRLTSSTPQGTGYGGGEYWDMRIPFETLLDPASHIGGVPFIDCEPHPSVSLDITASLVAKTYDDIYTRMASNFFGECAAFFLKDENFTTLKSNTIPTNLRFRKGDVYGCRIKMRRSLEGDRIYDNELGSMANNNGYDAFGAIGFDHDAGNLVSTSFPLPQDPRLKANCRETITMYSNPAAYGPPIAARPPAGNASATAVTGTQPMDSFNGFNPAYTPPYLNGECVVDFIFRPSSGVTYDGERILSELTGVYWRFDPGYTGSNGKPLLVPSFKNSDYSNAEYYIYSGWQINANSMQLSASVNLLGLENVFRQRKGSDGKEQMEENEIIGSKWVIQPKFETPILNFGDKGIHPITNAAGNLSLPTNFASASVPRGMWHQFGTIPYSPDEGIFLEIGDIPTPWLKYHYDVVNVSSVYNDNDVAANGNKLFRKMKSLTKLAGFNRQSSTVRLGEIAEERTIKEAIVAVPYIIESVTDANRANKEEPNYTQTRKKFINIPKRRFQAALKGSDGESDDGISIRQLIEQMKNYVLPPQFDFVNNLNIEPIVMYMFEFEYKLDQDDLSYIWQNLAPRDYKKMEVAHQSTSHVLDPTQLLTDANLSDNANLRWMVFKVKQKSQKSYYDLIASQVGEAATDIFNFYDTKTGYALNFNWPYDYLSFVELIKMDVEVLFKDPKADGKDKKNK